MTKIWLRAKHGASLLVLILILFAPFATADGLADFRAALQRLQVSDPIVVDAHFKLLGRSGEHGELIEREGLLELRIKDGPEGLQVGYAPALIAQLQAEELAKVADDNVKNSALNAVGQFEYWEWRELIYPVAQLELMLARSHFSGEKMDVYNGRPARCLTFLMPVERVEKSVRKYIKKYKHQLQVWIDDQGVPVASRLSEKGSGRIFIVIGFNFKNETHTQYQTVGRRLLAVKREVKDEGSGATMQSQRHFIATLTQVGLP